ncbi:MAG: hypothetical protein CL867_11910 [Cytophagaceae bacterium]|nr:hypothetical protein [Cytophagaceae bacterium]
MEVKKPVKTVQKIIIEILILYFFTAFRESKNNMHHRLYHLHFEAWQGLKSQDKFLGYLNKKPE